MRIGHLGVPVDRSPAAVFRSGYEQALGAAGLSVDEQLIEPVEDFWLSAGAEAATRLLQQHDPPTAVMCPSDASALGVIAAARKLNIAVPDGLAVMGYGDLPLSRLAAPPLATVHIPAGQLAHRAVETLRDRAIEDGHPQPPVTVPVELVPRESCGLHQRLTRLLRIPGRGAEEAGHLGPGGGPMATGGYARHDVVPP